jgi:hypothetical protein
MADGIIVNQDRLTITCGEQVVEVNRRRPYNAAKARAAELASRPRDLAAMVELIEQELANKASNFSAKDRQELEATRQAFREELPTA